MKNIFVSILIILLNISILSGQNVKFTGSAPKVVTIGQQFNLTYTVNTDVQNFNGPNLNNFNRHRGPSQASQYTSVNNNGAMSMERTITYSYIISGKSLGKFTIQPAQIKVNGKTYKSNQIVVEVLKQKPQQSANAETGLRDDDIFVKTIVSRTNVFQGQHFVVTLKLFSRTRNIQINKINYPSFDGFMTSDIEGTPNSLFRENYNGEVYYVGIFKKQVMFPQRYGDIIIDPFELDCQVSVQSGYQRNLFGQKVPGYKNVSVKIKSKPKKITVKPLPASKPDDYTGAVGSLTMKATLNKNTAKTNDAITLRIRLNGTGNLKLIDPLDVIFPPDFEVYDPKIINNYKTSEKGVSGTKTFEYLIIPRHAGEYTIPPISLSYFDVSSGKFKTLKSNEFNLSIEKGNDDQNTTIVSGFSKEDVKFIGKDIRFIKTNSLALKKQGVFIFGSTMFWLTYILALIIFVSFVIIRSKIRKESSNIKLVKNKRASKEARKRLKSASIYLKENNESKFYQEILSAKYGYLSDKLGIPVSDLTKESALEKLSQYNIEEEEKEKFLDFLNKAEFAQYAPGNSTSEMQNMYKEGERLIGMFENKIK